MCSHCCFDVVEYTPSSGLVPGVGEYSFDGATAPSSSVVTTMFGNARERRRSAAVVTVVASAALALGLPAAPAFAATETFSNPSTITIPSGGAATPYPSGITVGGAASLVTDVNVTLHGFTHQFMADVDILLVGPGGQSVVILSDAGCSSNVSGLELTFDQSAAGTVPESGVSSGTYRPTNVDVGCDGGSESFPNPAPADPWGSSLDVYNDTLAQGTWNLFVVDDASLYAGSIAGGWSLTIDSVPAEAPTITSAGSADTVVGQAFSHTFTATGLPAATFSYSAVSLPPGVTRSGDTLSGTPTAPGQYTITATASNGVAPAAQQVFTITVDAPPAITSAASGTAAVGTPFSHTFTATGSPAPTLSYSAESLPAGVTRSGDTLSGTPTQTGDFAITVTASNGVDPDAVQTYELAVEAGPAAPVISLAEDQDALTNSQPIAFTIVFDDAPVDFDETDVVIGGTAGGGVVTLEGGPLEWTASVSDLTSDGTVGLTIPAGAWTDAAGSWGPAASSPTVTLDTTPPVVTGPLGPVETTTDLGQPGAVVTFDVTVAGVDPDAECVPASGSFFVIGTTAVECTATDAAGNSSVLGFDVTVVDDEAPVIAAADDVTVELADGETSTPVTVEVPAATDNSGEVDVTCDLAPGTELSAGTHEVTCTAVDPSGNSATSGFAVIVVAPGGDDDEDDGTEDDGTEDDGTEDDGTDDDGTDDDGTDDDGTDDDGTEDDELSDTGSNAFALALGAALLLAVGATLVVTTSQRRRLME